MNLNIRKLDVEKLKKISRLAVSKVNLDKSINFSFDGKIYQGYEGDTLASALLANGVKIVGRSFKFHRPRGVFAAGKEEVNAFVQLEKGEWTEPNIRATITPIYSGLVATSQHAWPNANRDIYSAMQWLKPLLPAGFYYKTFMWPNWHFWERLVRGMAGLGKASKKNDPQDYHKRHLHTDVLIVGGGIAGLTAALKASESPTKRILLIDEQLEWGGSLLTGTELINGNNALDWIASTVLKLQNSNNVTLLQQTTVIGYYDHNVLSAVESLSAKNKAVQSIKIKERLWKIRAKQVVLATGSIERPLVFPNNDRPGIMLLDAAFQYAFRYGVKLGNQLIIYTNNDSVYLKAVAMKKAGINVCAIIDVRYQIDQSFLQTLNENNILHYAGYAVTETFGRRAIKKLTLTQLNKKGDALLHTSLKLHCDLLAISGGWTPTVHLFSQSGGKLIYNNQLSCFVPKQSKQGCIVIGSADGQFSTQKAIESATKGANIIFSKLALELSETAFDKMNFENENLKKSFGENMTAENSPFKIQPFWLTPNVSKQYQWVDFQYDVTASDIAIAAQENFISVEHFKRYTTAGMSIDQGKTSNVNALAILGIETERQISQVGTTKFRPPYHPTTIGVFAGRQIGQFYKPFQQLPAHQCHLKLSGKMLDFGGWLRAEYYPQKGETEQQTIEREVLSVRNSVGLLDYSPLGKLELRGPDARIFLNRMYINNIMTLKVGAARYGLILNEKGIVIDDGVMVCLAEDHFLVHTTSGGATHIHQAFEEWLQCEWTDLQVLVTNNTTQWATLLLSGPQARLVIQKLESDIDFSREAFPHMKFQTGHIMGTPVRVLRASFTGEVSYEISVPANYGHALWDVLMQAGSEFNITAFGIESLMVMRTEKGFLHVGQDTDGTTMPQDLGWGGAIAKKKVDFIGKRSLMTDQGQSEQRLQFVGIELLNSQTELLSGAHVVSLDENSSTPISQGYVTSVFMSPTLKRTVALGLVANGSQRIGETVKLFSNGCLIPAKLVKAGAYDPKGDAVNG